MGCRKQSQKSVTGLGTMAPDQSIASQEQEKRFGIQEDGLQSSP